MKLSNIVSKELLPDFAESISWVMNALDSIIQVIKARSVSIDAPLTMESIEALTDEELQALYAQYGLALYYPDISRSRRNWMLYNMARIWRYLGTPKAVEFLCQYIFSDIDIELKVHDNEAFDSTGRLINPDLVDVFDVEILPGVNILPPEANQRILENVIRFSRNSQALRQIYYSYDTFVTQTVSPALPYDSIVAVENVLNDDVCEDSPEPPGPTLPTIDFVGKTTVSNSSPSAATSITMVANEVVSVYVNGSITDYDLSKIYAVSEWRLYNNYKVANVGFGATDNLAGKLSVVNETGSTQSNLFYFSIYSCSSTDASIVTVYSSSNEAFNAFKFTSNGTDYYYVLDEVQNDWTDDLSSIGYFIPVIGYFKTSGASATTNESVSYRYWYSLYKADSASGSVKYLTGDSTKTYLPISAVKADGSTIDVTSGYMQIVLYGGISDVIQFKPATSIEAHHLLFKETT